MADMSDYEIGEIGMQKAEQEAEAIDSLYQKIQTLTKLVEDADEYLHGRAPLGFSELKDWTKRAREATGR